jgi:hypothetical protein
MHTHLILNRCQILRTTGQAVTNLAPTILSVPAPGKIIGVGCIGLGTSGRSRAQRQGGGRGQHVDSRAAGGCHAVHRCDLTGFVQIKVECLSTNGLDRPQVFAVRVFNDKSNGEHK